MQDEEASRGAKGAFCALLFVGITQAIPPLFGFLVTVVACAVVLILPVLNKNIMDFAIPFYGVAAVLDVMAYFWFKESGVGSIASDGMGTVTCAGLLFAAGLIAVKTQR